jgi:hypothetical protein
MQSMKIQTSKKVLALTLQDQNNLLAMLAEFDDLFDGTLGD